MDSGRRATVEGDEGRGEQLGRDRKGDKHPRDIALEPLTDASSKTFPNRTEGSVKKHWYKVREPRESLLAERLIALQDMHYADFAEDDVSFANPVPESH